MKRFLLTTLTTLFVLFQAVAAQADIIPLLVDSTQSTLTISLNNQPPTSTSISSVSGTGTLDVSSITSPFGSAQLTDLDLVLDQGLFLSLGFLGSGTSQPGDITVSLDNPGPAGIVSGGTFDQLGNDLSFDGDVSVTSILGNQLVDLSTLGQSAVDFTNIQISRSGNTFTIAATFQVIDDIQGIPFQADGVIVATGQVAAVPEPTAAVLLLGICVWFPTRRVR